MSWELPAFYLSIVPKWYDQELCRLTPSPLKSAAIGLMKEGFGFDQWMALQDNISTVSTLPGKSSYETLRFRESVEALTEAEKNLANRYNDSTSLAFHLAFAKLMQDVKPTKMAALLPTMHWWGTDNTFHASFISKKAFQAMWINASFNNAVWLSLVLGTLSFLFAVIGGTVLGLFYINGGSLRKKILQFILQVLYVFPVFCLAIIAVQFFTTDQYSSWLNWFPGVGSFLHNAEESSFFAKIFRDVPYLLLPAFLIAIPVSAGIALRWYTGLQDESTKPYVLTLRSKGLSTPQINAQHLLRNVSLPILAYLALLYPALISGSLLVENIFAIPGLGRLTFQAVSRQDLTLLLMIVGCMGLMTMLFNKITLWATRFVDPRVEKN